MGHIATKSHQFLISSFRDFMRTDRQTPPKTIPVRSMRAGNSVIIDVPTDAEKWHISFMDATD